MDLLVYKLEPQNTFKKVVIARIPVDRSPMEHAFAMTEKYAIVFDPPMYVDPPVFGILFKNAQIKDMIKNDVNGTTKIHVVRLSDGHVTTLDTKKWSMVLHFGNAYQIDDDTIAVEGPAYENPVADPFGIFTVENI